MSSRSGSWVTLLVTLASEAVLVPFAPANRDASGRGQGGPARVARGLRRPATVPVPRDNPQMPEKVALGQKLFFDPGLSGSGVISCSSCHNPALGLEDVLPKGPGHMGGPLARSARSSRIFCALDRAAAHRRVSRVGAR
jgi:cytochrome c peroxidase